MKIIEIRIKLEDEATVDDFIMIAEGLKDLIHDEEPLVKDITYEIVDNYQE